MLELLRRDKNVVSLDTPLKEDEDSSLVEFIPSDADFKDVVIHEVEQHNLKEKDRRTTYRSWRARTASFKNEIWN